MSKNCKRPSASKWKHFLGEEHQISRHIWTIVVLWPAEAIQWELAYSWQQAGTCPGLSEWNVALKSAFSKLCYLWLWWTGPLVVSGDLTHIEIHRDLDQPLDRFKGLEAAGRLLPGFSTGWGSDSFRTGSFALLQYALGNGGRSTLILYLILLCAVGLSSPVVDRLGVWLRINLKGCKAGMGQRTGCKYYRRWMVREITAGSM